MDAGQATVLRDFLHATVQAWSDIKHPTGYT